MLKFEIPKIKMPKPSKKAAAGLMVLALAAPVIASGTTLTAVFYTVSGTNIRGVEARTTGASGRVTTHVVASDSNRRMTNSASGNGSTPWTWAEIPHTAGTLVREAWSVQ